MKRTLVVALLAALIFGAIDRAPAIAAPLHTLTWSHSFYFPVTYGGWNAADDACCGGVRGEYQPGTGWVTTLATEFGHGVNRERIEIHILPTTLTSATVTYDATIGDGTGQFIDFRTGAGSLQNDAVSTGTDQTLSWSGAATSTDYININFMVGDEYPY